MRKSTVYTYLTVLFVNLLFLATPQIVNASVNDNVSVTTNTGDNTVCINGNCTTTSPNQTGHSTVCINGQCQSSNGDINVSEDNGNTQVHINNNSDNSSTQVTQNSSGNTNTSVNTTTNSDTNNTVNTTTISLPPVSPTVMPSTNPTPTPSVLSLRISHHNKKNTTLTSWFDPLHLPFQDVAEIMYYLV